MNFNTTPPVFSRNIEERKQTVMKYFREMNYTWSGKGLPFTIKESKDNVMIVFKDLIFNQYISESTRTFNYGKNILLPSDFRSFLRNLNNELSMNEDKVRAWTR